MNSTIAAPVDWKEAVGNLRFPSKADHRLQELMDPNNEGLLQESEREELAALAELSEQMLLVRGEALQILGKQPKCVSRKNCCTQFGRGREGDANIA